MPNGCGAPSRWPRRPGAGRHRTRGWEPSWCRRHRGPAARGSPAPPPRPVGPMPRCPHWRRPDGGPDRGRCTSRWSRAPIMVAPRPAPRPSSPPASDGWWWPSRTPIRWSPDVVSPACGPPASRSRWGSEPRRPANNWPRTSSTDAPAGPGSCSSWPPRSTAGRRHRTGPAGGSPARPPAATSTGCGPSPTPSWSGRARSGWTIPR